MREKPPFWPGNRTGNLITNTLLMRKKTNSEARRRIRRELKQKRAKLSATQIRLASALIAKNLWASRLLSRAANLAVYLAMPGEVDCSGIITGAKMRKMRVFAPILSGQKLFFAPLETGAKLSRNRYDIPEPEVSKARYVEPRNLDAVIVPLLGFDGNANRIGMGGGYYDRSFAFRKRRGTWRRPLLIGAAYSFQQVNALSTEHWDVPLDFVVTEQKILENH